MAMSRALNRTILLFTLACPVIAQQSFKLTAPDGSFEVSFPSEPRHEQNVSDSGPVHVEVHSYSFETAESKFVVTYLQLTPPPVDLKAGDAIDSALSGTVDNVGGKLLTQGPLIVAGQSAKAAVISVGQNTIIDGRFVYVKPRVYQLLVLHKKGVIPPFEQNFFDSFSLSQQGPGSQRPNFQPPRDEPFELGGDALGENLAVFVSNHPKAQCSDSTKRRINCYQWLEIAIFGMAAHPDPGCSIKNYSSPGCVEGLSAQFVDKHLVLLSYAVEGKDKAEAIVALKKNFGIPEMDGPVGTTWMNGNTMASADVGEAPGAKNGQNLITFMLMAPN
jgi:hypothetical protein